MASNLGSQSFRASQKALADLSGLSDRTQREILRDLQGADIITASDPDGCGKTRASESSLASWPPSGVTALNWNGRFI